jgi:hypothetical protein
MRFIAVILGALATVAIALPNESVDKRQVVIDGYCGCYPHCKPGCPTGTSCYCIVGGPGTAPCYPHCGCPSGSAGECGVSESPLYNNLVLGSR